MNLKRFTILGVVLLAVAAAVQLFLSSGPAQTSATGELDSGTIERRAPDKVDGDELLSLLSEMKMNPRPVLYKEYIDKTLNIESIPRNSSHLIYFTTLNPEKDVLTEFNQINQLARFLWNIIEISVVRLDD